MPVCDRAREADRADLETRALGRWGGLAGRRHRRSRRREGQADCLQDRMRVTVRLFARLRDMAGGAGELIRDVPAPATVQTVWDALVSEIPALVEYERTMSVAVNAEYARMAAPVHDGDEVAFLPPVSGG